MSNQQNTPPLWEQMHDAFMEAADTDLPRGVRLRCCIAAELRAVGRFVEMNPDRARISLYEAFRVAGVFYDEADRAEAGE